MLDEKFCHTLAGSLGGTLGAVITCPLEVVKVRLQSANKSKFYSSINNYKNSSIFRHFNWSRCIFDIYKKEGFFALYKGLMPTIFGVLPTRGLYFTVYHTMQGIYSQHFSQDSHATFLLSAMTASIIGSTVTSPIWFIKTRLQLHSGSGVKARDIFLATLKADGPKGFYRGISASYVGSIESAINYMVYEELKSRLLAHRRNREYAVYEKELNDLTNHIKRLKVDYQRLEDATFLFSMQSIRNKWWWPLSPMTGSVNRKPKDGDGRIVVEVETIDPKVSRLELDRILKEIEIATKDYEILRSQLEILQLNSKESLKGSQGGSKLQSSYDVFLCVGASMCSKVFAITAAYPHEVVRTRLRESTGHYKGFFPTLKDIYEKEGFKALYRGLVTHYIRQVPNQVIVITTYEGFVFAFEKLGISKHKSESNCAS